MTFHSFALSMNVSVGDPLAKWVLVIIANGASQDGSISIDLNEVSKESDAPVQLVAEKVRFLSARGYLLDCRLDGDELTGWLIPSLVKAETGYVAPPDVAGALYVVTDGQRTKVGVTKDITRRMHALRTSVPLETSLQHQISGQMRLMRKIERRAHELLATDRISGEWFSVPAARAIAAVSQAHAEIERGAS